MMWLQLFYTYFSKCVWILIQVCMDAFPSVYGYFFMRVDWLINIIRGRPIGVTKCFLLLGRPEDEIN